MQFYARSVTASAPGVGRRSNPATPTRAVSTQLAQHSPGSVPLPTPTPPCSHEPQPLTIVGAFDSSSSSVDVQGGHTEEVDHAARAIAAAAHAEVLAELQEEQGAAQQLNHQQEAGALGPGHASSPDAQDVGHNLQDAQNPSHVDHGNGRMAHAAKAAAADEAPPLQASVATQAVEPGDNAQGCASHAAQALQQEGAAAEAVSLQPGPQAEGSEAAQGVSGTAAVAPGAQGDEDTQCLQGEQQHGVQAQQAQKQLETGAAADAASSSVNAPLVASAQPSSPPARTVAPPAPMQQEKPQEVQVAPPPEQEVVQQPPSRARGQLQQQQRQESMGDNEVTFVTVYADLTPDELEAMLDGRQAPEGLCIQRVSAEALAHCSGWYRDLLASQKEAKQQGEDSSSSSRVVTFVESEEDAACTAACIDFVRAGGVLAPGPHSLGRLIGMYKEAIMLEMPTCAAAALEAMSTVDTEEVTAEDVVMVSTVAPFLEGEASEVLAVRGLYQEALLRHFSDAPAVMSDPETKGFFLLLKLPAVLSLLSSPHLASDSEDSVVTMAGAWIDANQPSPEEARQLAACLYVCSCSDAYFTHVLPALPWLHPYLPALMQLAAWRANAEAGLGGLSATLPKAWLSPSPRPPSPSSPDGLAIMYSDAFSNEVLAEELLPRLQAMPQGGTVRWVSPENIHAHGLDFSVGLELVKPGGDGWLGSDGYVEAFLLARLPLEHARSEHQAFSGLDARLSWQQPAAASAPLSPQPGPEASGDGGKNSGDKMQQPTDAHDVADSGDGISEVEFCSTELLRANNDHSWSFESYLKVFWQQGGVDITRLESWDDLLVQGRLLMKVEICPQEQRQ